ncbi:Circadian clock protein kinase KaiC [archaeon HR01]|nr:Circadian clock protein kinase KaiC [archaeon HR01]
MVERVVTGIRGLDAMLKGGLPKGSMTAVIGPPGSGKTSLGLQFLMTAALLEKPTAYILTITPETLRTIAEGFGWETGLLEKVEILDLFSKDLGFPSVSKYSASIFQLTDISIAISNLLKNSANTQNMRLVIDSMSDIITAHRDEASLSTFLRTVKSKLFSSGVTSMLLIEEGVHDAKLISLVESICDGTINLKQADNERLLTVRRMLATPSIGGWRRFTISTGVEIIADSFFF